MKSKSSHDQDLEKTDGNTDMIKAQAMAMPSQQLRTSTWGNNESRKKTVFALEAIQDNLSLKKV